MTSRTARTLVALVLAGSLVACGSEDDDDPTVSQPTETTSVPTLAPTDAPSEVAEPEPCESRPPTAEPPAGAVTDLNTKPAIQPDDAPPPCGLVIRDIVVGDGAEAAPTDTVEVKYVGAFYETGEEFDSSWSVSPDQTLPFEAGGGNLIPGFDQGVLGMKEGGRREIVIPSDLAYGPAGSGPIPGGATLVFVIDVVSAQAP